MLPTEQQKIRAAEHRVDGIIGFWVHATVYVLVIALLAVVDYRNGETWWVQWPALGWGIGLLGHAMGAFGSLPRSLVRWRVRKIDDLRSRM